MTNMLKMATDIQMSQKRKLPETLGTPFSKRKGMAKSKRKRKTNHATHLQNPFPIFHLARTRAVLSRPPQVFEG
jgi:hypothetical protein